MGKSKEEHAYFSTKYMESEEHCCTESCMKRKKGVLKEEMKQKISIFKWQEFHFEDEHISALYF